MINWKQVDWEQYEIRVTNYENEGMTRSDAQGIVDMEIEQEQKEQEKPDITEVRFRKGENKRFFGVKKQAKEQGYPDIPTFLQATGQVDQWCEVIPDEQLETTLKAEQARAYCQKIGTKYPIKQTA